MLSDEVLSVDEAARRLAISPSRVRALLASGELDGQKLAGTWMVDAGSVRRRGRTTVSAGRRLTTENVWAALLLASGEEADWLAPGERYRLLGLLDRDGPQAVAKRSHARARPVRLAGHPGILARLADDPRLVTSGVSAADAHGLELTGGPEHDAYIRESELPPVISASALEAASSPAAANVTLRVIADDAWHLHGSVAPLAAVAVDLSESPDARSARIGTRVLEQLARQRRWESLRRRPGRPRLLDPQLPPRR